ncbi:hypothetical protein [Streptomyces triticiradicis]|uniref:hypothetical protein n=1 Tax=Streptomyces triticiradicis TaxID=2651189 RepID=UPI001788CB64|nr:hypothetical protein [Streptomyces triticiradicis]
MARPAREHEVAVLVLSHPLIDPAATNGSSPVLRKGEGVMCPRCRGDLQAELVVLVLGVQWQELDEVTEVLAPDVRRRVENDLEREAGRNNLDPADAGSMSITSGAEELFDRSTAGQGTDSEGLDQVAHPGSPKTEGDVALQWGCRWTTDPVPTRQLAC